MTVTNLQEAQDYLKFLPILHRTYPSVHFCCFMTRKLTCFKLLNI